MTPSDDMPTPSNPTDAVVTLRVGTRFFAIPAEQTHAIHPMDRITPVPGTPKRIAGLTEVEGRVSTVIDFHARLGLEPPAKPPVTAVTVTHDGALYTFPVDAVEDVGTPAGRQGSGGFIETLDLRAVIEEEGA